MSATTGKITREAKKGYGIIGFVFTVYVKPRWGHKFIFSLSSVEPGILLFARKKHFNGSGIMCMSFFDKM